MGTQLDSIDISQLKAFALGLDHDQVSKFMHLTLRVCRQANAISPCSLIATRPRRLEAIDLLKKMRHHCLPIITTSPTIHIFSTSYTLNHGLEVAYPAPEPMGNGILLLSLSYQPPSPSP